MNPLQSRQSRKSPSGQALALITVAFLTCWASLWTPTPPSSAQEIPYPGLPAPEADPSIEEELFLSPNWMEFLTETDLTWHPLRWNPIRRTPDRAVGNGIPLVEPGHSVNPSTLRDAAEGFALKYGSLLGLGDTPPGEPQIGEHAGIWSVIFRQRHESIPVFGARIDFRFDQSGRLILFGSDWHPDVDVSTSPDVSEEEAVQIAVEDLGLEEGTYRRVGVNAVVLPVRHEVLFTYLLTHLVVLFADSPRGLWHTYVNAMTGDIVWRTNELRTTNITGTVTGFVKLESPLEDSVEVAFRDLRVWIETDGPDSSDITDEDGDFEIPWPGTADTVVVAELKGPFIDVDIETGYGQEAHIETDATPGDSMSVVFTPANSLPEERMVFHHMMKSHSYVKELEPSFTALDSSFVARVFGGSIVIGCCQASWSGADIREWIFNPPGVGCTHSAALIPEIIHHEYHHAIVWGQYLPESYTQSPPPNISRELDEGLADYWAATITDDPLYNEDMRPNEEGDECERLTDNKCVYGFTDADSCSGDCSYGDYSNMCAISGSLWHMRENLITSFGDSVAAVLYADSLFHFASSAKPDTIPDYLTELLLVDDENSNLSDWTPNICDICRAFERHGIPCLPPRVLPTVSSKSGHIWKLGAQMGVDTQSTLKGVGHDPQNGSVKEYRAYDSFEISSCSQTAVDSITYTVIVSSIVSTGNGAASTKWRVYFDHDELSDPLVAADWGTVNQGYIDVDPGLSTGAVVVSLPASALDLTKGYFDIEIRDLSRYEEVGSDGVRWNLKRTTPKSKVWLSFGT